MGLFVGLLICCGSSSTTGAGLRSSSTVLAQVSVLGEVSNFVALAGNLQIAVFAK